MTTLLNRTALKSNVVDRIAALADQRPYDLAVVSGSGNEVTFSELNARANHLAHRLRERGVGPEVPVGLLLNRTLDFVIAALAVMKAGGAYLPLDPKTPAARVSFILKDSGAALLLVHRCLAKDVEGEVMYLDAASTEGTATEAPVADVQAETLAYLIYTSGSTGEPKGVEITHGNLNTLITWHAQAFSVGTGDRASQMAGLGFDASVWEIWANLCAGATLFLTPDDVRTSAIKFRSWIIENQITIAFAPTVIAQQLISMEWPMGSRLRVLLTGAERLLQRPAANLPFLFFNNYGPTEATVVATSGLVDPSGSEVPSIGLAANGAVIRIVDGELCIAGPLVGRGYRNRPTLTAEKFVMIDGERMYRTGDRARLLPTGELEFLGRVDNQVKIRGYRIEPDEVAAVISRDARISNCVVTANDDALVAYVVADGGKLDTKSLSESLAASLPDYMVPAVFVQLDALPLTANGKCDVKALPAPANASLTEACGDLEARIGAMVAKLLKQPAVDADANFFLLGGHSLLAAQLMVQVNKAFGVKMGLRQIFQSPTVKTLAAAIATMKGGK